MHLPHADCLAKVGFGQHKNSGLPQVWMGSQIAVLYFDRRDIFRHRDNIYLIPIS